MQSLANKSHCMAANTNKYCALIRIIAIPN